MKKKSTSVLLNAPYTVWAAIFIIVPLFIVVYYAFTDPESGRLTLSNFKNAFTPEYREAFADAIIYSVIATVLSLVIAYPVAYAMTKTSITAQKIQMIIIMLPMWMNMIIRTYTWSNILERNGILNQFLGLFGIEPISFLGEGAVIFGMIYNYLPYMVLPIYTALSKIDNSLLEAAEDLGCSSVNKMKKLILPLSMPGIISGITMVFVPSISTFYISKQMSSSKVTLIGDMIERDIDTGSNEVASALSLILMVLVFFSTTIMNKFSDSEESTVV